MRKEEMIFLKLWNDLRNRVEPNKQSITPVVIYQLCSEWASKIKGSNSLKIKELYNLYLAYFEGYNIYEYQFSVRWYSLQDLIVFDILNTSVENLEYVIVRCRNIMWEILVFKSNKSCKNCDNELRVLTDKTAGDIFFCCDDCGYIENFFGEPMKTLKRQLSPITPELQGRLFLAPSIP